MNEYTAIENALIKQISNKDLRDSLTQIRKSVEAIWSSEAPRIIQGFTDHGLDHSLRLINYASQLLNINKGNSLSDEEMYLLIAGIYLHDIGMQCDVTKFQGIKDKAIGFGADFKIEFTSAIANSYSIPEQIEIRNNHHYLSAAWIDYAFHTSETTLGQSIKSVPDDLILDLLEICKYHSKLDIKDCALQFEIYPKGRKQLIASLVRFSDELDVAKSRVSIETVMLFSMESQNAYYWWLHHLTNIDITDNVLTLKVRLNSDDYKAYNSFISETYIEHFIEKNKPILDILKSQNISISISSDSKVIPYEYAPKLPDEIINAIKEMQAKDDAETATSITDMKQIPNNQLNDYPKSKPYFAGRKEELKVLNEVYETSPFIFIEGGGGIGKTQLVAKFIDGLSIKDRIVWYECIPTSQPDDLIKRAGFEELLKGKEKTEREKFSAFKDKIEEYDLVVFLDNYQEVKNIPSFKSFLAFINDYLRKGHLIVLCRDNIISTNLQAKRISVKGLGEDSLTHAQKLIENSYKGLINTSTEDLALICKTLKGYPLAIDLAVYLLSLKVSAQNIIDVTIKEAQVVGSDIEINCKRLLNEIFTRSDASEDERDFLKMFSIFRGKTKDVDVKSVIPSEIYESANRKLINRNLLEINNAYLELHPLIREFCYNELSNKKELHLKVAKYFIEKRHAKWNPELEEKIFYHLSCAEQWQEISNTIIQFGREYILQGYLDRLQQMIAVVKKQHVFESIFDIYEGDIAEIKGDWDLALSIFEKAKRSVNIEVKIEGMIKYGEMLYRQGNVKEAELIFKEAIEISNIDDYKKSYARSLNDLGIVNDFFGNKKDALIKYEAALKIRQELRDQEDIAISLNNIAAVKSVLGFQKDALDLYEESLKIYREIGDKFGIANSLNNIGNLKVDLDLKNEALDLYGKSLKIHEDIGNKFGIANSLNNIGSLKVDLGLENEAFTLFEKSLKISEEIGCKMLIASYLNNIGLLKYKLNLKNEAFALFEKSLKINEEIGAKSDIAASLSNIGGFLFENNHELEKAFFYLLKSIAMNEQMGIPKSKDSELYLFQMRKKVGGTKFGEMLNNAYQKLDDELKPFIDLNKVLGKPVKVEKTPGRNDTCNCGSGKKYKNCHGK